MALYKVLPTFAILYLFVSVAPAQAPLPASTQAQLATDARLEGMTLDDFTKVVSQAQAGQREAQYSVALAYEEGRLVTRYHAAAVSWMLKSAEQEYAPAQAGIGKLYLAGVKDHGPIPHRSDAEEWFRLAAEQGDADAQFWLGTAYQRGWFGGFDDREAFQWLRKSAAQGLPEARFLRLAKAFPRVTRWPPVGTGRQRTTLLRIWGECGKLRSSWLTCIAMARVKDKVQAYMWFAIVGSSVDPPTDNDMKQVAQHMTRAQIVQAQRLAEDWIKRHPWQRQTNVATSRSPAH
jgi:uncharacterized protein